MVLSIIPTRLASQSWDSESALALVDRAIARRVASSPDRGLRSFRAQAEGVVLFHVWIGGGGGAEPRLAKADQVSVEVYWQAPNRSKQIITRWRERHYLPTTIRYHRDHLGIATNDFGDRIRLGEGDEVEDVVHPLAPSGPALYQFALQDSLSLRVGATTLLVYSLAVRPRDGKAPGVVGTLYLERESASLVRSRFGFTAASYLQADLTAITVELENALFDQRYWLPWRQEIEIRRRAAWLDFPLETVIRGRWILRDYNIDADFPATVLLGAPYGGLPSAEPDTGWAESLEAVLARAAGPVEAGDLDLIRGEVTRLIGRSATRVSPPARLAFGSLSDLAHVNRVQGLAVGAGLSLTLPGARWTLEPAVEYGSANGRVLGSIGVGYRGGGSRWTLRAGRDLRDVGDWPVISGVMNSLLAQESGRDYGDYVLLESVGAAVELTLGPAWTLTGSIGGEYSRSVAGVADPASGTYAPNPALGTGRTAVARAGGEAEWHGGLGLAIDLEAGTGDRDYLRGAFKGQGASGLGPGVIRASFGGGLGSRNLPSHRGFLLGGRGTLVGEDFRRYGGRAAVLVRLEWQIPVGLPEIRVAGPIGTGRTAILSPFLAAGAVWGGLEQGPWESDGGLRPVLGVASELLFQTLRLELGWGLRSRQVGVVVDAAPRWWPIL